MPATAHLQSRGSLIKPSMSDPFARGAGCLAHPPPSCNRRSPHLPRRCKTSHPASRPAITLPNSRITQSVAGPRIARSSPKLGLPAQRRALVPWLSAANATSPTKSTPAGSSTQFEACPYLRVQSVGFEGHYRLESARACGWRPRRTLPFPLSLPTAYSTQERPLLLSPMMIVAVHS